MFLLQAPSVPPNSSWEWFKVVAPLLTGGVVGAIITALVTDRRNRIQPVSTWLNVSTVDIPAIMPGYDSAITLLSTTDNSQTNYKRLSTIQLKLANTGNKDLDFLDFGISLPSSTEIIGVQHQAQDRYHVVTATPEISISQTSSIIDFKLSPFHRKDNYTVTLIVSGTEHDLQNKIELSKRQPIKFVDATLTEKAMVSAINTLADSHFSVIGFPIIPLVRFLANTFRKGN